ncbi:hypothetical protein FQR65_LT02766 [Abscondita terminalis]|nr:hypothetical protein FQR65_LT02766 [Abscondita terminalis]
MILDSKNIKYDVVDIAEPGNEDAKEFMQNNAKSFGATIGDANPRSPLPPQIFNDDDYCGDYDQFDMANEIDEIEKFLKLPYESSDVIVTSEAAIKLENGENKAEELLEVDTKESTEQENTHNNEEKVEDTVDNKESAEEVEVTEEDVKKLVVEDDVATENTENDKNEENGVDESEGVEA